MLMSEIEQVNRPHRGFLVEAPEPYFGGTRKTERKQARDEQMAGENHEIGETQSQRADRRGRGRAPCQPEHPEVQPKGCEKQCDTHDDCKRYSPTRRVLPLTLRAVLPFPPAQEGIFAGKHQDDTNRRVEHHHRIVLQLHP